MTPKQISLVRQSWQKVLPIAPQAAAIFYSILFEMDPSLKTLFPSDITEQGKKLMAMLDTAVKLLDKPDKLIPAVQKLGERHLNYGAEPEHYDTVGAALLETLAQGLGAEFTAPVKKSLDTRIPNLSNYYDCRSKWCRNNPVRQRNYHGK